MLKKIEGTHLTWRFPCFSKYSLWLGALEDHLHVKVCNSFFVFDILTVTREKTLVFEITEYENTIYYYTIILLYHYTITLLYYWVDSDSLM